MKNPNLKGVYEVEMAAQQRRSEAEEVTGRPPMIVKEKEAATAPLK